MEKSKKLFHISWYQHTEDYRPLTFPPNEDVLSWWCSGYSDDGAIIVAYVTGVDEASALSAVQKDWPEMTADNDLRFLNQATHYVDSGRFPIPDWGEERVVSWSQEKIINEPLAEVIGKFDEIIDSLSDVYLIQKLTNEKMRLKHRKVTDPILPDSIKKWLKILKDNPTPEELLKLFDSCS